MEQSIQQFEYHETMFYAVVWMAACFTGMVRSARDHEFRSIWDLLAIGMASGFFGFAIVGVAYRYLGGSPGDEWFFVALAVGLGFLGKEQDAIIRRVFNNLLDKVLDKLGILDDTKKPE